MTQRYDYVVIGAGSAGSTGRSRRSASVTRRAARDAYAELQGR